MTTTTPTDDANDNPLAVTTRYFDALAAGDLATVGASMADDIEWHQPGDNRFSGVHRGPAAVGAMIAGMGEVSEGTFRLEVTGPMMANGELVAVPVSFTGERADARMDMPGVDLITVRGGRIVRVDLFSGDGAAEDAFWGRA